MSADRGVFDEWMNLLLACRQINGSPFGIAHLKMSQGSVVEGIKII